MNIPQSRADRMSNDSDKDSDHALIRKRLADDLKVLVLVQVVALVIAGLSSVVPLGWTIPLIGVSVFLVAALANLYKLSTHCKFTQASSLPVSMKIYSRWGIVYPYLLFLLAPATSSIPFLIMFFMIFS